MSSFLSRDSSSASPTDLNARKEALMNQVRQELALANAQELMKNAGERCFTKCVTKPGGSLSGSEQTCLTRCFDRYMEAFDIVSKTYIARLSRERLENQHGGGLETL